MPGMPNLHSHAFQRAMAGLTEYMAKPDDSFWSWRELMYRFAAKLTPEDMQAIARQLYIEMLKAGYTSVCEFHYLHHDHNGTPYSDRAEMSNRIIAAAADAGIGLTLLPVLYRYSGFGEKPPTIGQQRFVNNVDSIIELIETLRPKADNNSLQIGIAPHSLRAVSKLDLTTLIDALKTMAPEMPIHIHIAEQSKEVDEGLIYLGQRPVEWLLHEVGINQRWCLVHATHINEQETAGLAASNAVVALCSSTEANLGDGVFPATNYLAANGKFGIGSDSNVSISIAEELRLLEYSQRLTERHRNRLATPDSPSVADRLYLGAVAGGAQASGRAIGGLAVGQKADFLVLDENHPNIAARPMLHQSAGWIFCNHGNEPILDVYVGGQNVIKERHHIKEESAASDYRKTLARLLQAS